MNLGSNDSLFIEKYLKELEKSTNTKITIVKEKGEKLLEREFFIKLKS